MVGARLLANTSESAWTFVQHNLFHIIPGENQNCQVRFSIEEWVKDISNINLFIIQTKQLRLSVSSKNLKIQQLCNFHSQRICNHHQQRNRWARLAFFNFMDLVKTNIRLVGQFSQAIAFLFPDRL